MLACGWRHTLLGLANGDVFSWGRGVNGQLGHNEQRDLCAAPAPPLLLPPLRLSMAAPGPQWRLARPKSLLCWQRCSLALCAAPARLAASPAFAVGSGRRVG